MKLEEQKPDSPYVYLKWRSQPDHDGTHFGLAMEYWTFFFRQEGDSVSFMIAAPHAQMLPLPYKAGGIYWGALLKAHVFMPWLSKQSVPATGIELPLVDDSQVLIHDQKFRLPTYETAEEFVSELANRAVILANPLVEKALSGTPSLSERSIQRHVLQIAGLTRRELWRIRRARHAYALLQAGRSIADAVGEAGYTDQAHLTNSLKLLAGMTPGQIIAAYKKQ